MTNHKKHGSTHLSLSVTHPYTCLFALGVSVVLPFLLCCSSSNVHNSPLRVLGGVHSRPLDLPLLPCAVHHFGRLHIQVRCRYSVFARLFLLHNKGKFYSLSIRFCFRQRDRFLSKVQSLSFVPARGASSHPRSMAPVAPEGQTLVTFAPASYKELPRDEHEKQELCRN